MGIEYVLKRSKRARAMRLAIYPDTSVVVTAPQIFGLGAIERFVAKHSQWIAKHVERAKGRTIIRVARKDISTLKKKALALAHERCEHFVAMHGFTYKKIGVRAQKSRWGSCSKNGNLSFNYKIAILPPNIADYIIVHELCHLREMNHSRAFWALVACIIPDQAALRKQLRSIMTVFY